ncbi:MAG: 2-amino-4-hydroxy-6-hydroxymethyldihydropteridine diphosphokinase, partial [Bdellovibrionales bacterium]|nr:2-amino-4-hydroxy-6-hydroxymethyldihydropteridine diphosphokinase [Bdellovibrionales bacterium]
MATVYLALGSNLGNRRENLESAISAIKLQIGDVLKISTFYDFPAVLNQLNPGPQPDYLNGALACSSRLSPLDLLGKI